MTTQNRRRGVLASALAATLALAGCAGGAGSGSDSDQVTLTYWMWDSNQVPGYQQCATAFEAAGALERLEGFASLHGPAFYRLPVNAGRVTLRRETWTIPEALPFPGDAIVPLAGGETLHWRLAARA